MIPREIRIVFGGIMINRIGILLVVVAALIFQSGISHGLSASAERLFFSSSTPPQSPSTAADRKRKAFGKSRELLVGQVPFDPDILLEPDWKQRLQPVFDQMPELQAARQGGDRI